MENKNSLIVKVYLRYALLRVPDQLIYLKGIRGGLLIGEYQIIKEIIKNLKSCDYLIEPFETTQK